MQPCAEPDECADGKRNASGDRQIVSALLLIPADSGVLIAHRVAPKSDAVRIGIRFRSNTVSNQYAAIGWNQQKRAYDLTIAGGVALSIGAFVGLGAWLHPTATAETLLIRALGSGAFLLLNVVLCIGPLCRLDPRFLPLLYNRRHLGVTTFL